MMQLSTIFLELFYLSYQSYFPLNFMGNNEVSNLNLDLNEWEKILQLKNLAIYKNRITSEEIQEHKVILKDQQEFIHQQKIYQNRLKNFDNVVTLFGWNSEQKKSICNQIHKLKVYTERISQKLSEIWEIPYQKCIFIFHQSLIGFNNIYKHYKDYHFIINDSMIGFNLYSEIKVWINQKYVINSPSFQSHQKLSDEEIEHKIIKNLLTVVEQHCENNKFIPDFYHFFNKNVNSLFTFQNIKNIIEEYLKSKNFTFSFSTNKDEKEFIQEFENESFQKSVNGFDPNNYTYLSKKDLSETRQQKKEYQKQKNYLGQKLSYSQEQKKKKVFEKMRIEMSLFKSKQSRQKRRQSFYKYSSYKKSIYMYMKDMSRLDFLQK